MFGSIHLPSRLSARGHGSGVRRANIPGLLLVGALSSMIAAFALPMGAASAAARPAARSALAVAPRTSTFCTDAVNAAKHSSTSGASTAKAPTLQQSYAALKSEEPVVLSQAPSQIKPDFQALFNYLNGFYSALSNVKFQYSKLPISYYEGLAKLNIKQITADGKAIQTYVQNVCHVKL